MAAKRSFADGIWLVLKGLAMGAAAYLSKPVDPAVLYSTLEELLAQPRQGVEEQ